ncbi:MAG: hypothetical protein ACRCYO_15720 [Bacteroidia bacterium]
MAGFFADPNRRFQWAAHAFYIVMAILAVVFYQERLQADAAYYFYYVVDSENFRIEHQRYILGASQILPWLGVKIGLSLKALMILQSLNPVFWFYGLFLFTTRILRDQTGGIALILVHVLGVLHMHFCPMYEIWYGLALLVVVRSQLWMNRFQKPWEFILLLVLMITVLFSHPLLFIPLLFILLLDLFEKWLLHWKQIVAIAVVFVLWYILKKLMLTEYESGKMSMLDTSWNKAYENLFRPAYYWQLTKFFFTWYTIPVIMMLVTLGFYILRRARLKAILLTAFFCGHILLVNFTHENDPTLTLYFERMYMPLIPIAVLPFLYDLFTQFALRNLVGGILIALIVSWRMARMVDVGHDYKAKTANRARVIELAQQQGGSKFVLNGADFNACFRYAEWSFPMETMLFSSLNGSGKTVNVILPEDLEAENNRTKVNATNFLLRRWDLRRNEEVNQHYFKIESGVYQELPASCR